MNIILLSGGSGKLLWPLSNEARSKQFIKIFKKEDGTYESMIQRLYRNIISLDDKVNVTVVASKSQISSINNQLGQDVNISIEPARRNTFPAIALTVLYMVEVLHMNPDEPVLVCPVDIYADDDYFKVLKDMYNKALNMSSDEKLVILGVQPNRPHERYGYIFPNDNNEFSVVKSFVEKPSLKEAERCIAEGALWNGGAYAFKPETVINMLHDMVSFDSYHELLDNYKRIDNVSIDRLINDNEGRVLVRRFKGTWGDIRTWESLTASMKEQVVGNVLLDDNCSDVSVINEMSVPIMALGLHDVVISASSEGILITDKNSSAAIGKYVDKIEQQIMYADKSWGSYQVLDVDKESMTLKVTLNSGHSMNYHSHKNRDEVWIVLSGLGRTIVDGMQQNVKTGDVITMSAGCRHTIIAESELKLVEVQLGRDINVNDKKKHEL